MKVVIAKATNEGESLSVEVQLTKPDEWATKVAPMLGALDRRLLEMNGRYIVATQAIAHFPKKFHAALRCLIDALHGCRSDALTHIPKLLEDAEPHDLPGGVHVIPPGNDVVMADPTAMEEPA
jgi:hypothetical protein